MLDAVAGEFVRVSGAKDFIARDFGRDDLNDNVLVGEANDEAVLGRVVLVLGLAD